MKTIGLHIAKIIAKIIYFFLKLFPVHNKVTLISRISKKTSIEFKLITEEIKKISPKTKIIILNHKLRKKYLLIFDVLKEMYHLATSKAAIIDSYIIPISILKHKKCLKIIQIWHSIGVTKSFGYTALDKAEGANSKVAKAMNMHKNYDYILAGGKTSIPFYASSFNVDPKIIKPYGLPRIDYLLNKKNEINVKIKYYKNYPELTKKKNILYIPTFRKKQNIPYENIINNFDFENYNLIIKKHPLDKTKIKDQRVKLFNNHETFDLLFLADYIITDYSAVSFEVSILEKPIFFYIYDIDDYEIKRGLTVDIYKDMPGIASKNIDTILNAIKNDYYDINKIIEFKKKHIEFTDGYCTKRIVSLLHLEGVYYEEQNKDYAVSYIKKI